MKKLLLILLCLPMIGFGQITMIPDANFEQALINSGYDTVLDGQILTSNINTISTLYCSDKGIYSLEGIEDFLALNRLYCSYNNLTSLDLSNNTALEILHCKNNNLTSLNLSNNTALNTLKCNDNNLTSLNLSNNPSLMFLYTHNNNLISLNIKNGNNEILWIECFDPDAYYDGIKTIGNPSLGCIEVDDSLYSVINWDLSNGCRDSSHYFSENCVTTFMQDFTTNKELIKVTDLLGRESKPQKNIPFIEIYDDGTVEKKIVID